MTFKIEIFQFYDQSEPQQWKQNKFKSDIIFQWSQSTKIFQWFLQLAYFNFIGKMNKKKWSEIKSNGTCANLAAFFLIYKSYGILMTFDIYFLIRFISKWIISVAEGKWPSFDFIP